MNPTEPISLARDVEAGVVPIGTKVTLQKGEKAYVTQSRGGTYTVVVNGNMFRIDGKDADALGLAVPTAPNQTPNQVGGRAVPSAANQAPEQVEKQVWELLKTCYDPEIPVNIVDLGLIYDCSVAPLGEGKSFKVKVKMTLTAPGCGMGPMIAQEAQDKILSLEAVGEAEVEVVWDPPWNQSMLSETARLQLGLY